MEAVVGWPFEKDKPRNTFNTALLLEVPGLAPFDREGCFPFEFPESGLLKCFLQQYEPAVLSLTKTHRCKSA